VGENWANHGHRQGSTRKLPARRDTQALLEAFEHLAAEEKRAFTEEVLRRSLPFDSAPLWSSAPVSAISIGLSSPASAHYDPAARHLRSRRGHRSCSANSMHKR